MKEVFPKYYESFSCIADACEDTCCAGWEIDIDDASYDAYMRVGGDLGARLRACIKTYGEMREDDEEYEEVYEQHGFVLTEDMRCPFLDEHNLCDLYKELGENALCEVCKNTPRNFLEYRLGDEGMVREISISASCPEAARLIYGSDEPMRFTEKETADDASFETDDLDDEEIEEEEELGFFLKNVRGEAIRLLQDRGKTLHQRIRLFLMHAEAVQEAINSWEAGEEDLPETVVFNESEFRDPQDDNDREVDLYRHFLIRMGTYSGLASIGSAWAERMELLAESFIGKSDGDESDDAENHVNSDYRSAYAKATENLNKYLTTNNRLYEYEHLLVYYAFLLLNRSIDDYDYLGKAKLVVLSYLMNRDMDAGVFLKKEIFEKTDREENARIYAREVEHAEENLADLFEEILFERAYDTDALIAIL